MAQSLSSDTQTVTLSVTRAQAEFILEGLQMLLNCRRFSFKEPQQDPRETYGDLFAAVEDIGAQVRQATAGPAT